MEFTPGSSLTPPSSSRIERMQEYHLEGRNLPKSFQLFLHHFNGVAPVTGDNSIYSEAIDDDVVIERFLPLLEDIQEHPDGWADLTVVLSQIFDRLNYDPTVEYYELIPFAALFAGDFLVLDYRFDPPAVSFWDHERSKPESPHATVIAETFDDFLALIDVQLPQ